MKGRVLISGLMVLFVLPIFSCGGGGGAPGSSSSDDTGILIQSVLLSIESEDIDVFSSDTACDGEPEALLTDANVTMQITAVPDPPLGTPFPANIEYCDLSYSSSVYGVPIIESIRIYPNCSFADGETSCTLELLNIARKTQWWIDVGADLPRDYPTKYNAKYECKYQNSFGKSGTLGGRIDIDLADWLMCGG